MKLKKTACFIAALGCALFLSNAYSAHGWQPKTKITSIVIETGSDSGFSIFTNTPTTDCGSSGKYYVPWSAERSKEIYATALIAISKNAHIKMNANAGFGCPYGGIGSDSISLSI
ncbi:hypothetical protein A9Q99_23930 [Gammaproteobacteria bacterium 45_16_T64]|nr:hypothetical protein A9Q99_23930 [Gammaproteobacteria bacterium 45_16_T64]